MAPDKQLYRCDSCERPARGVGDVPCEFCGGTLSPVWGLGQLTPPFEDRAEPSLYAHRRAERP